MIDVFTAQAPIDSRKFVKSFAADGSANFDLVGFNELDFSGIFGPSVTSTTSNAVVLGTPSQDTHAEAGAV